MELARSAAQGAKTADQLREAKAVLLPAETGATMKQTAALLGVGRASVGRASGEISRAESNRTAAAAQLGWSSQRLTDTAARGLIF